MRIDIFILYCSKQKLLFIFCKILPRLICTVLDKNSSALFITKIYFYQLIPLTYLFNFCTLYTPS